MQKDYYRILQLEPHATLPEIKQAYRKLAMIYHPDKNPGDPFALVQFNDVKEAYEILTNPAKKDSYLQQRWYDQSLGRKRSAETITPVSILRLSLELEKYISTLDHYRMDQEGLANYVLELVSPDTLETLQLFEEQDMHRQIIASLLYATRSLPKKQAGPIFQRLKTLAAKYPESLQRINQSEARATRIFLWERFKIVVVIVFTILICLLIYLASQ